QGHANGRGSARRKKHFVQVSRSRFRQLFRQADSGEVSVAARTERKLIELGFDGRDDSWIAKTDLMNVVAVEIHVPPPLKVLQVNALAALAHVQTGSGYGLPQKV